MVRGLVQFAVVCLAPLLCSANTGHAQSDGLVEIKVTSTCAQDMRLAVFHMPQPDQWQAKSWWTLAPGASFFLSSDGARVTHMLGRKFLYIYAEAEDGSGYFGTHDHPQASMHKIDDALFLATLPAVGQTDAGYFDVKIPCDVR